MFVSIPQIKYPKNSIYTFHDFVNTVNVFTVLGTFPINLIFYNLILWQLIGNNLFLTNTNLKSINMRRNKTNSISAIILVVFIWIETGSIFSQTNDFNSIRAEVHFDNILWNWDGFGVNYVEEAQSRFFPDDKQEYGGFHLLGEEKRQEILQMIFGEEGLKPGLVKMFLDSWHQTKPGGPFNHKKTTEHMRYFTRNGLAITRDRGADLKFITTLYGPPAFMTKQKVIRGRDFDPAYKEDLAKYLISWSKFLIEEEGLPLKYVSLHNEGEDWQRWPQDGGDGPDHYNHDYNLYWPPEMVVDYLKFLPGKIKDAGLKDLGITPGEYFGWDRFSDYGYAMAIARDKEALKNLDLITSHGFHSWGWGRWNTYHTSRPNDIIQAKRPELHSWVTSTSWGTMDANFIREIYGNIYHSRVNAIIPWAVVQRPGLWIGGDPNAGCAFNVFDDGSYSIRKGYYFYKQVSRAGQPGMGVAYTVSMDAQVKIIAFASNKTDHPDAFVVVNVGNEPKDLMISISGNTTGGFRAYRSKNNESELYHDAGSFSLQNKSLHYIAPAGSVTTFFTEIN
jgi:hypothetical protein